MPALLIPLSLALQTALFGLKTPRESFLKAAAVVGVVVIGLTELLSLGHRLYFGPVVSAWLAVVAVQAGFLALSRNGRDLKRPSVSWRDEECWSLLAVGATALLCGLVGLLAAPNNFDAMTYHLPRVMHWIQDRSVAGYPANDLRQLAFPPGAAYVLLQLQVLGGSDRWLNGAQWMAFVGAVAAASLIAKRLGARRKGEVLAAALAASVPMAVLQAETTQNDLLTAFWLSCFAFFALAEGKYAWPDMLWLAASLGLAAATKPTGLIFGAALLLVVLSRRFRSSPGPELSEEEAVRHAATTALVLVLALTLSASFLWRNKHELGSWLPEDGRTLKSVVGLRQTAAGAMKNAALELPVPPIWRTALAVERHVLFLDPEDPGLNFEPKATRTLGSLCRRLLAPDEEFAGSPVHFLLLLWALVVLSRALWREKEDPWSDRSSLAAALLVGFIVYCTFFKWQEWGNRLMLPLFVLAAPLTAQILEARLVGTWRRGVLAYLGASGIFYAATAMHRPLIALPAALTSQWQAPSILTSDREEAYFSGYAKIQEKPLRAILDTIVKDRCGHIGLSLGRNEWEYPWWALTRGNPVPVMIKNVNVANASAKLSPEFPSSLLCGAVESEGGVMMYFDSADMTKLHAAGYHEPPRISEIRTD